MTYLEAKLKQEELCKSNPKTLHFIMGKNDNIDIKYIKKENKNEESIQIGGEL